jgi:sporulation protein YlmC with PRC-barrel domain
LFRGLDAVPSRFCLARILCGPDNLRSAGNSPRDRSCEAGVALVKVDLSVVAKGYRMSKIIGSNVSNDKDEKIGTVDDVIADKKQVNFAVLQVGGFLGMGGHLIVVPYESLTIDDTGKKIVLPGASKDELKKLNEYKYPAS